VPTETIAENRPKTAGERPDDDGREEALRKLAAERLARVRRFKRSLSVYVLALLVLTPIWIVTQYETSPGWMKHLSSRSRYPGDWDPWIIWIALVGAVIVAVAAYRAYVDRPESEDEVEREVERLRRGC